MNDQNSRFRAYEGDINISASRDKWRAGITDQETRLLLQRDEKVFFHQSLSTPCLDVIQTSNGSKLINRQGFEYLDFHGNNLHQAGFANPFIVERIKQQLDICTFSTRRFTNETAILCAERITSLLPPPLKRILFAPGGTSAVGMALKLARVITGKYKVISYYDSFHGASLDAIAAGGEKAFKDQIGPLMPGTICIPPPLAKEGFFKDEMRCADYFEYVAQKEGDIGAFIAEPLRNTDVQIPSKSYWQRIRGICDKYGIILILDEIPLAFGRTGKMFAFEHFDIQPDIICLGKALGGGMFPFAAMVAREEYNVAPNISIGHYTHEKSPLGAAACLATLDFLETHQIIRKVKEDESFMRASLAELAKKYPIISQIRGIGLLWGIELTRNEQPAIAEAEKIMYKCLQLGLSFKVSKGNVITLAPALTISREELERAIKILDDAMQFYA